MVLPSLLQQAITAGSFFGHAERTLTNGDLAAGFRASDHIIEGEVFVGAQEHFYMETQSCVAVPHGEDGEMEVFSSTQAPMGIQVLLRDTITNIQVIVCWYFHSSFRILFFQHSDFLESSVVFLIMTIFYFTIHLSFYPFKTSLKKLSNINGNISHC